MPSTLHSTINAIAERFAHDILPLCAMRRSTRSSARLRPATAANVEDGRPDEARDAKQVAEMVVRAVLDWLHKHPAI